MFALRWIVYTLSWNKNYTYFYTNSCLHVLNTQTNTQLVASVRVLLGKLSWCMSTDFALHERNRQALPV